jgi:hypothetical protein
MDADAQIWVIVDLELNNEWATIIAAHSFLIV